MTDVDTAQAEHRSGARPGAHGRPPLRPAGVGAVLEPAAPGPADHRGAAHRPGGGGRRRGARPRPRHRLARAVLPRHHRVRRARRRVHGAARRLLARAPRRRPHPRRRALPPGADLARHPAPARRRARVGTRPARRARAWCARSSATAPRRRATSTRPSTSPACRSAPLLVVCINNGWAISTPADHQTAASTFAAKAAAAGIPGVRVDGNDVLAVVDADTRRASARGRR